MLSDVREVEAHLREQVSAIDQLFAVHGLGFFTRD